MQITNLKIFKYFLYLGIAGFGGPLAIIEYMRRDLVFDKKWMTLEEFKSYFGYSQIAPGPLAFQVALYFCYFKKGFWSAVLSFIGLVLPSYLIVLLFSIFYKEFNDISFIIFALYGISPVIISIIFYSGFKLSSTVFTKDYFQYILFFSVIAVSVFFRIHILYLIISSALISLIYHSIKHRKFKNINSLFSFVPFVFLLLKNNIFLFFDFLNSKLLEIAFVFMKAGALTYGSGFVIIGVLRQDIVENLHWLTAKEFIDGIAFGQITPGPVVITSTFIGYMVSGFSGSLVSTASIFLPSFVIVMILTQFIKKIEHNFYLKAAIKGANAAAIGAIMTTGYFLAKDAMIDYYTYGLFIAGLAILFFTKIKPYYIIIAGAVLGIVIKYFL